MVEVRWQLVNFLVPRDGYLRISLDGKESVVVDQEELSNGAQLAEMSEGKHTFRVALISREGDEPLHEETVALTL